MDGNFEDFIWSHVGGFELWNDPSFSKSHFVLVLEMNKLFSHLVFFSIN